MVPAVEVSLQIGAETSTLFALVEPRGLAGFSFGFVQRQLQLLQYVPWFYRVLVPCNLRHNSDLGCCNFGHLQYTALPAVP